MNKPKLYSYVVHHDYGLSPNPSCGYCTLAFCKFRRADGMPNVVELAKKDDWVAGTGGKSKLSAGHGRLVYAMKVTEKMTLREYFRDPRFAVRGGNVEAWADEGDMYALISDHFYYFGAEAPRLRHAIEKRVGFAGAMRRSELVGLDITDVALTDDGLVVAIRKSKTDQVREGREIGIPFGAHDATCPVRAVAWIEEAEIEEEPLFRSVNKHGHLMDVRLSDRAVANVVQRSLVAAGKSARGYAAHSLRAGLITQAAMAGVSERAIQDQSGHKSLAVMRRYIRDGSLFRENAAAKVGL